MELDTDITTNVTDSGDRRSRHDEHAARDDRRRDRRLSERRGPRAGIPRRDLGRGGQHVRGAHCARRESRDVEPEAFEHVPGHVRRLGDARKRHAAFTSDEQYKRSASADGGPDATQEGDVSFNATGINDGVPPGGEGFSPTIGDWSGASTSGTTSGTVTPGMTERLAGSAGSDYAIIQAAYAEAQKVWRDTRCVIVTAPGYIPASSFANNNKPTHTEQVEKGSTTEFQVASGTNSTRRSTPRSRRRSTARNRWTPTTSTSRPAS